MTNYKIILDEEKLDNFITDLPELNDSEVWYLQAFGRKKYLEKGSIQSGYQSLNRFACKTDRIKDKIRQLEIPLGYYKNREIELPNECIAVYMSINPRCHEIAAKNLLKVLADKITKQYEFYNTYQLAMTEIHRSCKRRLRVAFDFDDIEFETIKPLLPSIINLDALKAVKTRGGFHLIVTLNKIGSEYSKTWYKDICSLDPDVKGQQEMISVIPGVIQGGFSPYFLEI